MNQPTIGYTIKFDVNVGADVAFEEISADISQLVEKEEPGTVMYEWFVSDDGGTARLCEWFTDSEAAVAHITGKVVTQNLPKLLEAAEITEIEVYGEPSEKLAQVLDDFPTSGPFTHIGGFTR